MIVLTSLSITFKCMDMTKRENILSFRMFVADYY